MSDLLHPILLRRLRRYRASSARRALFQETRVEARDLVQPLFVKEDRGGTEKISSMPGMERLPISRLVKECRELQRLGIRAVALFPCIASKDKDPEGSYAFNPDNLLFRAIRAIKKGAPDLLVIADVALDPYTSHGHDGLLDPVTRDVENDTTVEALGRLAVLEAEAGADWVAPSDMMDGRVRHIRCELDTAGYKQTGILSYAAKFASSFYGPFREAVGSLRAAGTPHLDKRTYQLNPSNTREALLEADLDEAEGADVLMIKPAGPYLDIIRQVRVRAKVPVAAYQVSGEYAQIHAAAQRGWLDLKHTRDESLLAIKRAGADIILTYFAKTVAKDLLQQERKD